MANDDLVVPRFKTHSRLNRAKTQKEGRPIYDDMEVCEIRFSGNRQTVGVYPAHEVFKTTRNMVTGENEELTYAMAYKDQYLKFKNNEIQDQSGTPLAELPFLTQGKRLELKALNVHTAEALAAIDGQPLKQLGMGGRELKSQAQAYLDKAAGTVDVAQLAARIAALEEENAKLKGDIGAFDHDGDGKPGGAAPQSPFTEMDSEDIRNWIASSGGAQPRANASHVTLVRLADELNAELAKKAKEVA